MPESATITGLSGTGYVPHMIVPAFTDVRIFMMLTSWLGVAAGRGRNDPGVVRNRYVPQTIEPAFTVVRIFMCLPRSRESPPNEGATIRGLPGVVTFPK